MYFRKKKAPDTAVGKLEGIGCPSGVILKECPVLRNALSLFYHRAGHLTRKTLSSQIKFKERKR